MAETIIVPDKNEILGKLLVGLNKQIDYLNTDDYTKNMSFEDRQKLTTELGNIHTKLTNFTDTETSYTVEDIAELKAQYLELIDNLPTGGGETVLTFEDLTQEQKDSLKGDKGDTFSFEDLTEYEKKSLFSSIDLDTYNKSYTKIDNLFIDASKNVNNNLKYIVVGDSTRDTVQNKLKPYYTSIFSQINVSVYDNSSAGQSALDWFNNTDGTTLQQCLDNCSGVDGEDTIIEFSLGLNDVVRDTEEEIRLTLNSCIQFLIDSKPKANIVLCTPVSTEYAEWNDILSRLYIELSNTFNLKLIDCNYATSLIVGNSDFYFDEVHPNVYGSMRFFHYILNELLPFEIHHLIKLEETYFDSDIPTIDNLFDGIVYNGYWNTAGNFVNSPSFISCLNKIEVLPNNYIDIEHYGTEKTIFLYDIDGNFLRYESIALIDGDTVIKFTIPSDVYYIALNITRDIPNYTNNIVSVKYTVDNSSVPSLSSINEGLNITIGTDFYLDSYTSDFDSSNLLKLGKYYMFVDSLGKLRIKDSQPTFENDGLIVGFY